jgi:hypothetical protein
MRLPVHDDLLLGNGVPAQQAWVMALTWSSWAPLGKAAHSSMKSFTLGAYIGCGRSTLPASIRGLDGGRRPNLASSPPIMATGTDSGAQGLAQRLHIGLIRTGSK